MAASSHASVKALAWVLVGLALGSLAGATYLYHATPKALSTSEPHYYAHVLNSLSADVSTIDRISKSVLYSKSLNVKGGHLRSIFNPLANRLYIIEHGGTNIYSLDPSTLEVKAVIPAGKDLQHGAAFTLDGNYLLAVSRGENALILIDTSRDVLAATVKVDDKPHDVTIASDKNAYVTNTASRSISVVDLGSRKVIETIKLDAKPHMIVASRSEKLLAVGADNPYKIIVIDSAAKTVTGSIALTGEPHGLALVEKQRTLLATIADQGVVAVVNLNDNRLEKVVQVGKHPHSVDLTPDEKYAYVSNSVDGTLSILDVEKLSLISTVDVGSGPHNAVFYLPSKESIGAQAASKKETRKELPSANFTCGG